MIDITSIAYHRIFERGGRKFKKFEINEDQNENFPAQNQVCLPAQTWVKTKKKRSSLKFNPDFGPNLGEDQKNKKKKSLLKFSPVFGQKKVFAHRFCAQTFSPSYKRGGGGMRQFCVLFHANYIILATQSGGP